LKTAARRDRFNNFKRAAGDCNWEWAFFILGLHRGSRQGRTRSLKFRTVSGEAMDKNTEDEEQRQPVVDENRRLSNECEYTKDENRRLSNECKKWKRIAIPAVVIVIVGLVMRLLDGNQLNLWAVIGLVCVGLWISFANTATRT
jgi:hypothetical protein